MKGIFKRLTAALAACALFGMAAWQGSAVLAAEEGQRDYLALGDSISAGYGLSDPDMEGFAARLAAVADYDLTNRAVDGNTADGIYAQFENGALDAEIIDAELITITCGGNDLMGLLYAQMAEKYNSLVNANLAAEDVLAVMAGTSSKANRMLLLACGRNALEGDAEENIPAFADSALFDAGLAAYVESLTAVMQYIRDLNDTATVVVTTQYNPYRFFAGSFDYVAMGIGEGAAKLSDAIRSNAEPLGYVAADVHDAFEISEINLCQATASL